MTHIQRHALVPFSTRDMFDLVSDIESYPEFLPWCGGAEVLAKTASEVEAGIDIAFKGIRKRFVTRNRFIPGKLMTMQLLDGPFKSLQGAWTFTSLGDQGSKIELDLDFEFANALAAMTIGPVFNPIAGTLVESFVKRAQLCYGE